MSSPHGVGFTVAVIGACMAVGGVLIRGKLVHGGAADPENSTMPRLAAFNQKTGRVCKWIAWAGLPVAVVGLIIWAAS